MEYYSAIKRNEVELFVVRWMDVESVIRSEVSQKEKNKGPWVLASSVSDLVGLQEGLGLASLRLLLLCPQRQLGVDHEALPLSLDLGPAGLGAEELTGRTRDHWWSACLAFSRVPTFLAIREHAFPLQGGSNPCLCLWGDRTLLSADFHSWGLC